MSHGIFNDPTEHAIAARIDYHRRGLQNAFPDQGALTSHLMALEVVEEEADCVLCRAGRHWFGGVLVLLYCLRWWFRG